MSDKKIRISFKTIKAVAAVICGNVVPGMVKAISPYRTNKVLDEFFLEDLGLKIPEGLKGSSRQEWTEGWLKKFNEKDELKKIIESSVRPPEYVGTEFDVVQVVTYLNESLIHDNLRLIQSSNKYILVTTNGVELKLSTDPDDVLTDAYVQELSAKCDVKITNADYDGAITNARTLIEAVLGELESRISGGKNDYKGDLPKQFKQVTKLLNLDDERKDLDERFKDVIRGLITVVHGLAPLRNKMSDGHARDKAPAPHHSRVIVNASKTIASFLVESYLYQKEKGLLTKAGP